MKESTAVSRSCTASLAAAKDDSVLVVQRTISQLILVARILSLLFARLYRP